MDFHADRKTFQKNYFDACRSYHLPVNNKANLLYHLALKYEDSKDADVFDLLMIAVADTGLYLSHFDYDTIDAEYEQKQFNKRYTKLLEHRKQFSLLSDQWNTIIAKKDVANDLSFGSEHSSNEEELIHLCYLYRKIFQVSEQESQELANNLTYYIPLVHHDSDFESIAPLFLYQLMVCHTSRLATKKSCMLTLRSSGNTGNTIFCPIMARISGSMQPFANCFESFANIILPMKMFQWNCADMDSVLYPICVNGLWIINRNKSKSTFPLCITTLPVPIFHASKPVSRKNTVRKLFLTFP